jgi:hypothetical protein
MDKVLQPSGWEIDQYGYIDKTGKLVIPCQFESATGFKDGLAKVSTTNEKFYINTKGERIMELDF